MRGTSGTIDYTVEEFNLSGESVNLELEVTYNYSPGTPDVHYLPNGDPGYPGDPSEVEWTAKVKKVIEAEQDLTDERTLAHAQAAFDQRLNDEDEGIRLTNRINDQIDEACFKDAADKSDNEPDWEPDLDESTYDAPDCW